MLAIISHVCIVVLHGQTNYIYNCSARSHLGSSLPPVLQFAMGSPSDDSRPPHRPFLVPTAVIYTWLGQENRGATLHLQLPSQRERHCRQVPIPRAGRSMSSETCDASLTPTRNFQPWFVFATHRGNAVQEQAVLARRTSPTSARAVRQSASKHPATCRGWTTGVTLFG